MNKIRHSGIVVSDIDKARRFYEKFFNFSVAREMNESGSFIDKILGYENITVRTVKMYTGSSMLELLEFKNPEAKAKNREISDYGCTHIAITVQDLNKLYKDLKEDGIRFISEPQTSPDGNAKVCFCRDHDGTYLELVEEVQ
tara:strand:- start:13988 stop:14413 length:426 start_codon:yes stop_codon:yes gene_type:complete